MSENPSDDAVHQRAQGVATALLTHHRAGDADAMAAVLRDTIDGSGDADAETVAAGQRLVLLALVELAHDALVEQPDDVEGWLADRLRRFHDPT